MIAQKLKYYRLMQRITQRDLAEASGVSPSAIGKIEAHDVNVSIDIAVRLAKALEVRLDKLVGGLSQSQKDEMIIANRKIYEQRQEKRTAQRREQKARYNERQSSK
jgi:transcriptional regulator with XRE-family HTH domain